MREERLRTTTNLRGGLNLSAWRGRSGRRYVVGVHALSETDLFEVTQAVLIAVRRDRDGIARVVEVAAAGSKPRETARWAWLSKARARGATEMHVHRLARDEAERRAIVADLREDQDEGGALRPASLTAAGPQPAPGSGH